MGKKVRIGVIGAGSIATGWHLPQLAQHPDVELAAIADAQQERAAAAARQFSIPQVFADPLAMVAGAGLEAVVICTPTGTHAHLAVAAMRAGLDVLVEKPMARTVAEAEAMVQAAREHDRILMIGMVRRFKPETALLREMLAAGDLGEIYYSRATSISRRGVPSGWFTDKELAGGGAVLDIGVHALDLAWYLMGTPEPVSVSGQTFLGVAPYETRYLGPRWTAAGHGPGQERPMTVEDGGVAMIRFAGGKSLLLEAFWAVNGPQEEGFNVRLYGTKGGAMVNPLKVSYERDRLLFDATPVVSANIDAWREEISHFITCVQERREPLAPAKHGLQVMRMLEAIYRSAETGREIILK